MGADDGEQLPIWGPLEFRDMLRGKARDLVSGGTIEGLREKIVHALIANDICHRFSIGSEGHGIGEGAAAAAPGNPRVGVEQARRGL